MKIDQRSAYAEIRVFPDALLELANVGLRTANLAGDFFLCEASRL